MVNVQQATGISSQHCMDRCALSEQLNGTMSQLFLSNPSCGCFAFFDADAHWSLHEMLEIRSAARSAGIPLELVTVLRDPVERVASEFRYLQANPAALSQDEWDYMDRRSLKQPKLSPLGAVLQRKLPDMNLDEFISAEPNGHPAHNRQVDLVLPNSHRARHCQSMSKRSRGVHTRVLWARASLCSYCFDRACDRACYKCCAGSGNGSKAF